MFFFLKQFGAAKLLFFIDIRKFEHEIIYFSEL